MFKNLNRNSRTVEISSHYENQCQCTYRSTRIVHLFRHVSHANFVFPKILRPAYCTRGIGTSEKAPSSVSVQASSLAPVFGRQEADKRQLSPKLQNVACIVECIPNKGFLLLTPLKLDQPDLIVEALQTLCAVRSSVEGPIICSASFTSTPPAWYAAKKEGVAAETGNTQSVQESEGQEQPRRQQQGLQKQQQRQSKQQQPRQESWYSLQLGIARVARMPEQLSAPMCVVLYPTTNIRQEQRVVSLLTRALRDGGQIELVVTDARVVVMAIRALVMARSILYRELNLEVGFVPERPELNSGSQIPDGNGDAPAAQAVTQGKQKQRASAAEYQHGIRIMAPESEAPNHCFCRLRIHGRQPLGLKPVPPNSPYIFSKALQQAGSRLELPLFAVQDSEAWYDALKCLAHVQERAEARGKVLQVAGEAPGDGKEVHLFIRVATLAMPLPDLAPLRRLSIAPTTCFSLRDTSNGWSTLPIDLAADVFGIVRCEV